MPCSFRPRLVRQGKALYAGISSYPDPWFSRTLRLVERERLAPITIHQPHYHMLARSAEREVLPTAGRKGVGVIAFCPLAQGILAGRYLNGIPPDSRAAMGQGNGAIGAGAVTPEVVEKTRKLDAIAKRRGQSLAQMSLAWLLKDQRVTSVLMGASKPQQVIDAVGCLAGTAFAPEELAGIDAICGPC